MTTYYHRRATRYDSIDTPGESSKFTPVPVRKRSLLPFLPSSSATFFTAKSAKSCGAKHDDSEATLHGRLGYTAGWVVTGFVAKLFAFQSMHTDQFFCVLCTD